MERFTDFDIFVGNTNDTGNFSSNQHCYYQATPFGASEERLFLCPDYLYGQYVIIQKRDDVQPLTVCEVEVHGVLGQLRLKYMETTRYHICCPGGGGGGALSIYTGGGVPQHLQKGGGVLGLY